MVKKVILGSVAHRPDRCEIFFDELIENTAANCELHIYSAVLNSIHIN